MSPLVAPKNNDRIIAPEGTAKARCIGLIQIGTVPVEWMGETKFLEKIRLTFELPEELHKFKEGEEDKPIVISQEYTHSMGEKSNLRPLVEGIIGTALHQEEADNFDHETLVGMPCLLNIKHKTSEKSKSKFAIIETATPLMKKMTVPDAINPLKILTYEKWNQEEFNKLPEFIKERMKTSKQYVEKFGNSESDEISALNDSPF